MASIASPNFLAPPPPLRKQGGSLFISLFSSLMLYLNTNTNTGLEGSSVSQTVQFGRKSGFGTRLYAFELAPLPYDKGALAPFISEETLDYHHGKHQKTYVVNLNNLISGTELEGNKTLEEIILITHKQGPLEIFNTAAEVWNHQFYWNSMSPNGGGQPTGQLLNGIRQQFGSFDIFANEFRKTAMSQIGSGWAWLAYKPQDKKLALVKTSNAENPLVLGYTPLLAIDVWEHAYHIDYRNARANYVDAFMHVVSWEAASKRLEAATVASSAY